MAPNITPPLRPSGSSATPAKPSPLDPKTNNGPAPEAVAPPPVMKHDGSGSFIPRVQPSDPMSLDTHVTVEFCLEQFARVMQELAERQEDVNWVQSHLTLAQEWHAMVDSLFSHQAAMEQMRGDLEMKQQQMVHTDMDHQMGLSHQDAMNKQQLTQQQQQHEQNMKVQDQMNKHKVGQQQLLGKQAQDNHKLSTQHQIQAHQQKLAQNDQMHKTRLAPKNPGA